jgi:hypothetical protein
MMTVLCTHTNLLTKRQQTIGSYPEIPYSEFCLSRLRICFQQSPKITMKKTIIVGPPRLASSTPCGAAPVPPTNGVLYPVRLVLAYPGPDPVNLSWLAGGCRPAHKNCTLFYPSVGGQQSGIVFWVLSDYLGFHHSRRQERKKNKEWKGSNTTSSWGMVRSSLRLLGLM